MQEGKYERSAAPTAACRVFDAELGPYLEGEDRPGVVVHAQECPFCHSVLADLEQIRSLSGQLVLDDPPARVWANIRASLIEEGIIREPASFWQRLFPGWQSMAGAAPAVAMICAVILGAALLNSPTTVDRTETAAQRSSTKNSKVITSAQPAEYSRVTSTLGEMEKTYQAHAASFDPSVKAAYQKSLESLDREIRECLNSVQREPEARDYLLTAYAQKAQVLQSALEFDGH